MNCPNCLAQVNPQARFCSGCGQMLNQAPQAHQPVQTYQAPAVQAGVAVAAPATQEQNALALAAMIVGICGSPLVALILGHISYSQIKRSNGRQTGTGFALTGIILGWIGTVLVALFVVAVLIAIANDPTLIDSGTYY